MDTEDAEMDSTVQGMSPEWPGWFWGKVIEWTPVRGAIVDLIVVAATVGVAAYGLASVALASMPPGYLRVFVAALCAGLGLVPTFGLAIDLHRAQVEERRLQLEHMRDEEKEFFQGVESDIATLLDKEIG